MSNTEHGITLGIENLENDYILIVKVKGKLTHVDYQKIIPLIDGAASGIHYPDLKVLVDISGFEGWEWHAAWDDLVIGLKHGTKFGKMALYGHKDWQEFASKVATWVITGEVKAFEDYDEAMRWLKEGSES